MLPLLPTRVNWPILLAKAEVAAQKLLLTAGSKDVDVDTAKVASEAAQQAADLAQAAASAAIEAAAGAGSDCSGVAGASAAIEAVTDATLRQHPTK